MGSIMVIIIENRFMRQVQILKMVTGTSMYINGIGKYINPSLHHSPMDKNC